jgi:hypothetical protein
LLTASYHAGAWDLGEFKSTTADTNHGLGWVDNTTTKQVTVAYTLYGDTTLDGTVSFARKRESQQALPVRRRGSFLHLLVRQSPLLCNDTNCQGSNFLGKLCSTSGPLPNGEDIYTQAARTQPAQLPSLTIRNAHLVQCLYVMSLVLLAAGSWINLPRFRNPGETHGIPRTVAVWPIARFSGRSPLVARIIAASALRTASGRFGHWLTM